MATYSQEDRWLRVLAPKDLELLALSLTGREAISELFHFELDALVPRGKELDFSKLINRPIALEVAYPISPRRPINGIVNEVTEIERDDSFTRYRIGIVPAAWRLTQSFHNRIFQQKSVVDILRTLFEGLSTTFNVANPTRPHNYCVQYRESDFDFAHRLMGEQGLLYYFVHEAEGHRLVIADTSRNNPTLPSEHKIEFNRMSGGTRGKGRVHSWRKTQRIGTAKVSSRDYHFALPDQSLQSSQSIMSTVQVGKVTHHLTNGNDHWTIFDPRGEYAHMFDGISPTGDDQASNLKQVFDQKDQSTRNHMEAVAAEAIVIRGEGDAAHMVPGFVFQLEGHYDGDGKYLITEVEHDISAGDYRAGQSGTPEHYSNRFKTMPLDIPYRPAKPMEKPRIPGAILANVVGPPGEEIFTDKFGRIKIQFPWDLEGKRDGQSSCWVRPFSPFAGNGYGMIQIPRVGHEVLVGFIEGDPDEPVILGSAYNPNQMPPFKLPDNRTRLVMKSQTKNGDSSQFSGMAIEDASGQELLHLHSEKDVRLNAENNHMSTTKAGKYEWVGKFNHRMVGGLPGTGGGQDINPNNEQQNSNDDDNGDEGGESENEYVGPFHWKNGDIESILGADVSLVYGIVAEAAVGLDAAVAVGPKMEIIVNPIGIFTGGGLLGGMIGGNYELNFCPETRAIYGDQYEVHHGGTTEVTGYANDEVEEGIKVLATLVAASTTAAVVAAGGLAESHPSLLEGVEALCGFIGGSSLLLLTSMEHICADGQDAIEEAEFAERLTTAIEHWTQLPDTIEKLTEASVKAAKQAATDAKKAATDAAASQVAAKMSEAGANQAVSELAASRSILINGGYTIRAQDIMRISAQKVDSLDETFCSDLVLEAIGTPEGPDGLMLLNASGAVLMQAPSGASAAFGVGGPTSDIIGSVPPEGSITLQMIDEFPQIKINQDGIFLMANPDCGIAITEEGISILAPIVTVEAEESMTLSSDETIVELTPEGIVCEGLTLDQTFEVSLEVEVLTIDFDSTEVTYVYAMFEVM
jgi:type VI secretion system secreted protein VgrG